MKPPQTVLVTGGAGLVGSHLVERLLAAGHRVRVIDDLSTGRLENLRAAATDSRFSFLEAKVSACDALPRLAAEADFIFHLAAAVGVDLVVQSPIRTITTNLTETEAVLEAAGSTRTPVLVTSTSEVYGKSQRPAFSEEDDLLIGPPRLARWSYACSKLMDEFLAMAHWRERQLPVTVVRLFNTVGPRQTGRFGMVLPRFIEAALANRPLRVFGDGSQTRCFCLVHDTVEVLVRLMSCEPARGEVVNVGNDEEVSILELAQRVVRLVNSRSAIEFVPYREAYGAGFEDMARRRPLLQKCEQLTGYRPHTSLDDIIRVTAASLSAPA